MYVSVVVYVPAGWLPGTLTMYEEVKICASVPPAPPSALSAIVLPVTNLKLLAVSYPPVGKARPLKFVPLAAGVIAVPTAGVVLTARFMPNWLTPCVLAVGDDNAVMVLPPDVNVAPLTVMT